MEFLATVVVFGFVVAGMGVKWLFFNKAMNVGCGKDPIVVNGKKLDCVGCPEEKRKACDDNTTAQS
jgi:hypothetical protein